MPQGLSQTSPPVLALAALPGTALGRLGEPSTASSAAGAAIRMLHDAPLPPCPGRSLDEIASSLDSECTWLVTNGVLPTDLVTRNRRVAEAASVGHANLIRTEHSRR
jgi:hypothetical protein